MSGRRRKKRSKNGDAWWSAPWVAGLFLVVLAVYLGLSLTAPTAPWWLWLAGGEFDEVNRVDPAALTAPQRMMLKEAFRQARLLQLRLQQAFLS